MCKNVGGIDRTLRIVIGLVLLSLLVLLDSGARWFGLIGIPLVASGLLGSCGAYKLLGLSTCPMKARQH